jgi:hypothetical protein
MIGVQTKAGRAAPDDAQTAGTSVPDKEVELAAKAAPARAAARGAGTVAGAAASLVGGGSAVKPTAKRARGPESGGDGTASVAKKVRAAESVTAQLQAEVKALQAHNAALQAQLEGVRGSRKVVDIDTKLMALKEHVTALQKPYKDHAKPLNKTVKRSQLVADVFDLFERMPPKNLVRVLRINFHGEGAIDQGGCTRELFSLFFDKMFSSDAEFALLECQEGQAAGDNDGGNQQSFLPKKGANLQRLRTFGKVLMKTMLTDEIELPQCLPPSFFDYLIDPHKTVPSDVHQALNTLSFFDHSTAASMTRMLEQGQFEGLTAADFDGTDNDEQVTGSNVHDLIRKKVAITLVESRSAELSVVRDGFFAALQGLPKHLELFSGFELMDIMCGEARVTAALLLNAMDFQFSGSGHTEHYFKQFLSALGTRAALQDGVLLKNTLFFATGLCVMPKNGLRQPIAVVPLDGTDAALLQASTCSFTLKVPTYSSYDIFEKQVRCSIENGAVGFGQQ